MSTTYPDKIQTFPVMQNINSNDAPVVKLFQEAMLAGDIALANQILTQISNYKNKFFTADLFNTIGDTVYELQKAVTKKYAQAIIVSKTKPTGQNANDYWWEVQ